MLCAISLRLVGADLQMHPAAVNLIMASSWLMVAASGPAAQQLSRKIGRIQVALLCRVLGVSMLVAMSFVHQPAIAVPLYLFRCALMNCWQGLTKSVLNDYIDNEHRAKWNSFEVINTASWSGSSMFGGWLIDQIGYRHTFLITAGLQMCSIMLYAPLVMLVAAEPEESSTKPQNDETAALSQPTSPT